jgi:hypothetical protein
MKAYSDLGPADFTVSYRFLRPDEGGLSRIPQQHTRWAFLYSEDDPQRDGAWDIWPEFLGALFRMALFQHGASHTCSS